VLSSRVNQLSSLIYCNVSLNFHRDCFLGPSIGKVYIQKPLLPLFSVNGLTYSIGFDKVIVNEKKTSPLEVWHNFVWLFEKKRRKILERAKWLARLNMGR
jgi:hypothetical protein